jgi:putative transposase
MRWVSKLSIPPKAIIDGIETAHMIRKGQLSDENIPAYKQFMALAE